MGLNVDGKESLTASPHITRDKSIEYVDLVSQEMSPRSNTNGVVKMQTDRYAVFVPARKLAN